MAQIGDETDLFFVFLCEFLQSREFMRGHFGSPNGIDRKEDHIFLPLFQNLTLNLTERLVLQGIYNVFQERQSLGDALT